MFKKRCFFAVIIMVFLQNIPILHAAGPERGLDSRLKALLDVDIAAQWSGNGVFCFSSQKRTEFPNEADSDLTQCLILYVHGYAGPLKISCESSMRSFRPIAGALKWLNYRLCHPGLDCRRKYMSFAQGFDVYQVEQHLRRLIQERDKSFPGVPIICIGHSNGASTLISMVSKNHDLTEHVKGVILLAPYADITEASALKGIPKMLGGKNTARRALKWSVAPKYDRTIASPVECVLQGDYPQGLPTLLAHSKGDRHVPYNNFEMLQKAFKVKNDNAQFLSLEYGAHFFMHPSPEFKGGMKAFIDSALVRSAINLVSEDNI